MQKITVNTPEATMELGTRIAPFLQPEDLILLDGDLGAGKTTFTKGLAAGLGIKRNVKSPTFTIIREYQDGRLPLYHMDAYRLDDGSGDELGLDEYFNGDGINVVEWSKFVEDELPNNYLRIIFKRNDELGDHSRTLTFDSHGQHFANIVKESIDNDDK